MSALLQSFAAVLDEFGVSYGRGRNAALCAIEGLIIVRYFLWKISSILVTLFAERRSNGEELIFQHY
jgi:nuclear cap-binding protein subunit 1